MWVVYEHKNKLNGKIYIGITSVKVTKRWGKNGCKYKDSPKFWRAIQKYGWESFEHNILFENLSEKDAKEKEKELISIYKKKNISYNITDGGDGVSGLVGPMKGKHHSESSKRKTSTKLKGRISPMKGKHHSESSKKKIGDKNRGKKMLPHIKQKLLECHLGVPLSEEHKKKLSEAHKGKKHGPMSEEIKKKISDARKGQQIGRQIDDQWKQNIRIGIKKYWENYKLQHHD